MRSRSAATLCWGVAVFLFLAARTCFGAPPLLVGMELEVEEKYLVHLIPYFDVSALDAYDVPLSYLRAPEKSTADATTRARWDKEIATQMIKAGDTLKLRADCPAEVRAVLDKLNWSQDFQRLEFRHTTPYDNLDDYVKNTNRFLELVKMDGIANHPLEHLGKTHLHFHLTVKNGRDHTEIAERLNNLAALKFIEGGAGEMMLADTFGFWDVQAKGLLCLIDKDRLEIRNHFTSAEADVREVYRLLTQPEEASRRELSIEIRKRLTPEAIRLLAIHKPAKLASLVERTNADLPTKIAIDGPELAGAILEAAHEPKTNLHQFHLLLKQLAKSPLATKVALELQKVADADPTEFARRAAASYGKLLIAIYDAVPASERKIDLESDRWIGSGREWSGKIALAALALRSTRARAEVVEIMKRIPGLVTQLPLEALADRAINIEAHIALSKAEPFVRQQFFRNAWRQKAALTREFKQFLPHAEGAKSPEAAEIENYLKCGTFGSI